VAEEVLADIKKYSKSPSVSLLEKIKGSLKTLKYSEIEMVLWNGLHSENGLKDEVAYAIIDAAMDPKHYKERIKIMDQIR